MAGMSWRAYLTSTHFWGPVANWAIPLAAIGDFQKDPELISPYMTPALIGYSSAFARFAWMVKPRNLLLLACHMTNITAQCVQACRYVNYFYLTKPEDRKKHHIEVVEKEIHSHPEQYPKVHIKDHPSPREQVEEVKEFDAAYKLPKETPIIT